MRKSRTNISDETPVIVNSLATKMVKNFMKKGRASDTQNLMEKIAKQETIGKIVRYHRADNNYNVFNRIIQRNRRITAEKMALAETVENLNNVEAGCCKRRHSDHDHYEDEN